MTTDHDVPEPHDALGLLRREHQRMEELLARLKDAGEQGRQAALADLAATLRGHVDATEGIFFPAVREAARDRGERGGGGPTLQLLMNGVRQHDELLRLLDRLTTAGEGAGELEERLRRHLDDEETGIMTAAEDLLDDGKLFDLGRRMTEREQVIEAQEELVEEVEATARTWLRRAPAVAAALLAALLLARRVARRRRALPRSTGRQPR